MTKGFEALIRQVEKWGIRNGLTPSPLTKAKQALCVVEETNEFCLDPCSDEAGDIQVTLIILAHLYEIDPIYMYEQASVYGSPTPSVFNIDRVYQSNAAKLAQFVRKNKRLDIGEQIIYYLSVILNGLPLLDIDPQTALSDAYYKISKRKVKKIGGSLVKEEDIS